MVDASLIDRTAPPALGLRGAASSVATAIAQPRLPWPVMIYMITVVTPVAFYLGPMFLTGLRTFLLVMFIPLTCRLLMGRYDRLYVTDVLFLAHCAWSAVALHVNNPDMMVMNSGIYTVEFFGAYVLARAYIRGPDEFSAMIRFLVLLVLLTVPLALHESQTGRPLVVEMIRQIPGLTSVSIVDIEQRMGLERVQAVFAHPIHYGLFTSTAFATCFVALKGEIGDMRRILSAGLAGLVCFLSLSSGAFLTMLMQIFLIGWAAALAGVRQRWVILLALTALAYVLVDLISTRSPIRVFFSYATFSAHNAYWRGIIFEWGMMNVNDNPIFGIGLNDWVRPHFMHSGSMDNFWLVQAVRYGYPGILTMAVAYAIALWRIMRRDFDADARIWRYRRAWVFTFVGITFTLCTVHIWTSVFSYTFFLFGAGMWMIAAQPNGGGALPAEAAAPIRPSRYARFAKGAAPAPGSPHLRGAAALRTRAAAPARLREAQAYARGREAPPHRIARPQEGASPRREAPRWTRTTRSDQGEGPKDAR